MDDGNPLRVHLESDARQGGVESAWRLANPPPLSPHVTRVWNWFCDMSKTRPTNGVGLCRLPRSEIAQWEQDEGIRLSHWQRRAILALDELFVSVMTPKK